MRSQISRYRLRCLTQAASVAILAGITAGCSSDFTRFDRDLYAALPRSANQPATAQNNPYPGVDPTTTASIGPGVPKPLTDVRVPRVAPDHSGYQSQEASNPYPASNPYQAQNSYNTPDASRSGVIRQSLPAPGLATRSGPGVDPVNTASVPPAVPAVAAPVVAASQVKPAGDVAGWTSTGGTAVTMRSGETLYNLSKRYGVPVNEIVRANNLRSAGEVQAGQQIIIPTYVYSSNAPVSAPDNDPNTRAARASIGLRGEADPSRVPAPTRSPYQTAALNDTTGQDGNNQQTPRYQPRPRVKDESDQTVPDYSIVTGSVARPGTVPLDGVYTVQSGDTLSKIASMSGVSTKSLMDANGLVSSSIRVGQTLRIPDGKGGEFVGPMLAPTSVKGPEPKLAETAKTASNASPSSYTKPSVDSTVTNSVDTKAPEATGIDKLRWPVRGRVVSGFGDKRGGGTNYGIDISVPEGTTVHAAENGVVIYSGNELEEFGNLVLVRHAGGYVTAYAHNKINQVAKGAEVARGQVIALSGRTGKVTAPVLHFEVRKDSKPVDPVKYLGG